MNVNRKVQTLDEFTIQQLRDFPQATGELSHLLRNLGLAAKRVNVEVNKAGLVDILGDAGTINVQGEEVKKLDVYANDQFTGVLRHGIACAGIASEEPRLAPPPPPPAARPVHRATCVAMGSVPSRVRLGSRRATRAASTC